MRKYRWLFITIIISAIALAIPFSYNETFNFSYKINHEKFGDYFTSLGALITGLTLIMLVRQLDLMSKQQQPNLVLQHTSFNISEEHIGSGKVRAKLEQNGMKVSRPQYTIINHGTGNATDIEASWYIMRNVGDKVSHGKTRDIEEVIKADDKLSFPIPNDIIKFLSALFIEKRGNTSENEILEYVLIVQITYDDSDQIRHEKIYQGFLSFSLSIGANYTSPVSLQFHLLKGKKLQAILKNHGFPSLFIQ